MLRMIIEAKKYLVEGAVKGKVLAELQDPLLFAYLVNKSVSQKTAQLRS